MVSFSYSLFAKLAFTSFWGAPHPPQHVGHPSLRLPELSHACPHLSQLHEPQPANRALSKSKTMLLGLCPRLWLFCNTTGHPRGSQGRFTLSKGGQKCQGDGKGAGLKSKYITCTAAPTISSRSGGTNATELQWAWGSANSSGGHPSIPSLSYILSTPTHPELCMGGKNGPLPITEHSLSQGKSDIVSPNQKNLVEEWEAHTQRGNHGWPTHLGRGILQQLDSSLAPEAETLKGGRRADPCPAWFFLAVLST